MAELIAKSPCAGLLPITVGRFELTEANLGKLTSVMPYMGKQNAISEVMLAAHGVGFPTPNTTASHGDVRVIWFGRNMALLSGDAPKAELAKHAALTDQSDAWAAVKINGEGAEEVLARLSPVDFRLSVFATGQTCRTLLGHMTASITRLSEAEFLVLVFRSMAVTLVDELQEAMEAVDARG